MHRSDKTRGPLGLRMIAPLAAATALAAASVLVLPVQTPVALAATTTVGLWSTNKWWPRRGPQARLSSWA